MTHTFFLLTTPLSATTGRQHLLRPVDTRRLPRSVAAAKVEPALCADPPSAPHCANGFPRAPVDSTATWGGQEQRGSGEIRETYPTHTSPWQPHTLAIRRTVEKGGTLTNHMNTPHAAPTFLPGRTPQRQFSRGKRGSRGMETSGQGSGLHVTTGNPT